MGSKIRKIQAHTSREVLSDLQKYRDLSLSLGATDAKIIETGQIIIDDRVRMRCLIPICPAYGTNPHCPPHIGDLDKMRSLVNQYQYAIIIMLRVPSEELAGDEALEKKLPRKSALKMDSIVSKIESTAFYDGYHLATGYAHACKGLWCPDEECSAMQPGKSCRHALRSRAAIHALGIDSYSMANRMGWDIYPCGEGASPEDLPHGTRLGIVLIH